MLKNQTITLAQLPASDPVELARPEAGPHLHAHQAAVLLHVRDRRARAAVRREHRARGRAQGLHDDRPAPAAPRDQGDPRHPSVPDRPGGGDRLGRAGHRRDPRDDRRRAQRGNQFNLAAQSARQAGSTFKTFVLASAIEQGVDPDSTYYTSAPFTCSIGPWCQTPWQVHTYDNTYRGSISLTRRDARLRQHRLRAADARRRAALRLADGAPPRRAHVARQAGRVDRPRLARRLAARHGGGVRDLRGAGDLREADGDHEGDPAGEQGRQRLRLGQAADEARALAGRCVEGDRRARPERAVRHGRRLGRRDPSERGQDRHDREPRRRVVRRLHAAAQHRRLDGLPEGRDPDAERARPCRSPARRSRCRSGTSTWPPRSGTTRCSTFRCPTSTPRGARSRAGTTWVVRLRTTRALPLPPTRLTTTLHDDDRAATTDARPPKPVSTKAATAPKEGPQRP